MGIRNFSKKMQKANTAYKKLRGPYLLEHPICHAKIHNCTIHATDVHHKKGRGVHYLDVNTWLPVCRNCHMWIEENTVHAIELGFSMPRTYEQESDE
jgi:hypothetical protein|tara:strand:+ start:89 stop:379 length:291 start_codon:yes stop_codon:yes gene_type:complete